MTVENDIVPFCTITGGANLLDQTDYLASPALENGNQPGLASSKLANKTLRQTSLMCAALAQCICDLTGQPVVDADGVLATVITNMKAAFAASAQHNIFYGPTVGGTGNNITITTTPNPGSFNVGDSVLFIPTTNCSGAVNINVDATGSASCTKEGTITLENNDIVAGRMTMITWDGTRWQLINSNTFALGAFITAASTTVLDGMDGRIANVSGTTTINNMTLRQGDLRILTFSSITTLSHSGNMLLNTGGVDYTTAVGDRAIIFGVTGSNVSVSIIPVNGQAVVPSSKPAAIFSLSSGPWVAPSDTTSSTVFKVTMTAPGGGGAGTAGTHGSGGGGAGATSILYISGVAASSSNSYTQGAVGTGGASGDNNGTAGGNSSFTIGGTTITANGGGGGNGASGLGNHTGGAGGVAANGSVNTNGGDGGGGDGSNVDLDGGLGGSSFWGGGGAGGLQDASINPRPGVAYGSGGGGGGGSAGQAQAGGDGAPGILVIERISG